MRRAAALAVIALASAAPAATAQARFKFGAAGDTALGLIPNQPQVIRVAVNTAGYQISRARLTFHYDPTKLAIEAVDTACCSELYLQVDTSRAPGRFSVGAANGFYLSTFGEQRVFGLQVRLLPGVTDGTWIHAEVDTLIRYNQTANDMRLAASEPMALCHASSRWGDVDGDSDIDSRDALITLTAAVGLPVTGFNLAGGDVDGDALTNSRDALMMLSHSIGQFTSGRVAVPIPDACAPSATLGDRIVYVRDGSSQDSIFTLPAGSSTPAYIPNTGGQTGYVGSPRLAANGTTVAYNCPSPFFYIHICRVETDGSGFADISPQPFSYYYRPQWSAGDTLLAYVLDGATLHLLTPNGSQDIALSPNVYYGLAWNRTGTRIAYSSSSPFFGTIRAINPDNTGDAAITTGVTDAYVVRWNPAGDSIAFTRTGNPGIWVVAASGGTPVRLTSLHVPYFEEFDWGPEGILLSFNTVSGIRGLWLLPSSGGPARRVTGGNDRMPSFRRIP